MIVVTGSTGNIGSKLTEILLSKGEKVRTIGRSADRLKGFVGRGAEAAVGTMEDAGFLAKAFSGASAAFAMIPPDYTSKDFHAHYNRIGSSIASAIKISGMTHVVNLSSQGAHLPEGTGPIKGLHDQEQRLNRIEGVNILHLRPTYFMENLLMFIDMIKSMHIAGSAIRGDLKFAMIATKDIAAYAAERLAKRDFSGKPVRDLLGQRDISLDEAVHIIGEKIGKPGLRYVQFSYEEAEKGMVAAGLSEDVSRLFIEMSRAINGGLLSGLPRTAENTTAIPFEEFAEMFAQIYKERAGN